MMPHRRVSPSVDRQVEHLPKKQKSAARAVKVLGAIRRKLGKFFPNMNETQLDDAMDRVLYHAREVRTKQDKEVHPRTFREQR